VPLHTILGQGQAPEFEFSAERMGGAGPVVSRVALVPTDEGGLAAPLVTNHFGATYFALHAGQYISSPGSPHRPNDQAICLVVRGSLWLDDGDEQIAIKAGDLARFMLSYPYRLLARGAGAEALLVLPADAALPTLEQSEAPGPEVAPLAIPAGGPFRLVAMREARKRARRAG
jgi:hypothetical protein